MKSSASSTRLRVEAASRPTPQPLFLPFLGTAKSATAADGDSRPGSPTANVLNGIVVLLTRMRDDDRAGRLNGPKIAVYKAEYDIKIDQALTYEKALPH